MQLWKHWVDLKQDVDQIKVLAVWTVWTTFINLFLKDKEVLHEGNSSANFSIHWWYMGRKLWLENGIKWNGYFGNPVEYIL